MHAHEIRISWIFLLRVFRMFLFIQNNRKENKFSSRMAISKPWSKEQPAWFKAWGRGYTSYTMDEFLQLGGVLFTVMTEVCWGSQAEKAEYLSEARGILALRESTVPCWELSASLCCWKAGCSPKARARLALAKENPCCWTSAPSPHWSPRVAHWVSTERHNKGGELMSSGSDIL